jgi:hypothetical protein
MRPAILNWDRCVRLPALRLLDQISFQVFLRCEIQLWYMLKFSLYNCGKQGHVEKLTVAKLVSKFSACCGTRKSIVVFTEASGQCPEQIKRVQNLIFCIHKSSFNIIRPPTRAGLSEFFDKNFLCPCKVPCLLHAPDISSFSFWGAAAQLGPRPPYCWGF